MSHKSNNILFFVIIIVIILCIVAYDNYTSKMEINKLQYMLNNSPSSSPSSSSSSSPGPSSSPSSSPDSSPNSSPDYSPYSNRRVIGQIGIQPPPPIDLLKDYDYRAYADPLTPPFKRDDYMIPAQAFYPNGYDYYTRGEPGMFKKVGYLKNLNETNTRYEFLTLLGRQKYMGSTQYEYYVTSTNSEQNLKFYLEAYKRELYDGDSVYVPQLKSNFEVFIDKNLDFEYSSRIF